MTQAPPLATPNDFPRAFASAFGAQDHQALAHLFTETGSFHLLTGSFAEGPKQIAELLNAEFAGLSRMARLVTGKTSLQALAPGLYLLHQRFVVTGLRDESGQEMPRIAALLTAVLRENKQIWRAQSASFTMLAD